MTGNIHIIHRKRLQYVNFKHASQTYTAGKLNVIAACYIATLQRKFSEMFVENEFHDNKYIELRSKRETMLYETRKINGGNVIGTQSENTVAGQCMQSTQH